MSTKEVTILKTLECPSLSGRSMLTYNIGMKDDTIHIALSGYTGEVSTIGAGYRYRKHHPYCH